MVVVGGVGAAGGGAGDVRRGGGGETAETKKAQGKWGCREAESDRDSDYGSDYE